MPSVSFKKYIKQIHSYLTFLESKSEEVKNMEIDNTRYAPQRALVPLILHVLNLNGGEDTYQNTKNGLYDKFPIIFRNGRYNEFYPRGDKYGKNMFHGHVLMQFIVV